MKRKKKNNKAGEYKEIASYDQLIVGDIMADKLFVLKIGYIEPDKIITISVKELLNRLKQLEVELKEVKNKLDKVNCNRDD